MAAIGQSTLERVDALLPARHAWLGGATVLEQVQAPPGPQDPGDLAQGAAGVGDGAQREGAEGGITRGVGQLDGLTVESDMEHRDGGGSDAVLGNPPSRGGRLDGEDLGDLIGVVGDVEARAEADLEDPTGESLHRCLAESLDALGTARELDEPRDDVIAVEAHGGQGSGASRSSRCYVQRMASDTRTDKTTVRRLAAFVSIALVLAGCSTSSTSAPTTTTLPHVDDVYAKRYCEVLLVDPAAPGGPTARVYSSFPMSDCPEAKWKTLETTALAKENKVPIALLNGPRYWAMDSISKLRTGKKVTTTFGGIVMDEEATVALGDLAKAQTRYVTHEVDRKASFTFKAGRTVSELTSADGSVYVMQSWSQQIDPTLTAAALPGLADKLSLPTGWSYATRKLTSPLVVQTTGKVAHVLQDDVGDSYSLETAG